MPRFSLVWSSCFKRTAKRFLRQHPDLRNVLSDVLHKLECDPNDPSLRVHALRGKLEGKQAVSLTYSYRLVVKIEITESEIILLDIGSHDEVYK
jgi:mRNA interferase YafQ